MHLEIKALDNPQSAMSTAHKVFEEACEVYSAWESVHACECNIGRNCRKCSPGADGWLCLEHMALARECADVLTALSTLEHKLGHTRGGVLRVGCLPETMVSSATDKGLALAVPRAASGVIQEMKTRGILRIGKRWLFGNAQPIISAVLMLAHRYSIDLEAALWQVERSNRERGRRYVGD